jgi:hypothetical protein
MTMRKLLTLALFCLVGTAGFGSAGLVQQAAGGSASNTFAAGGTLTTNAVGFPGNTTLHDHLFCVVWVRETGGSEIVGVGYSHITVTTSGFSWACLAATCSAASGFSDNLTAKKYGLTAIYEIQSAAVMSTSVTTTVTAVVPSSDDCTICELEFSLYEFSGVGSYVDLLGPPSNDTGTATNPAETTLCTSSPCFMFFSLVGFPGSNLTAQSGWTLGENAATATIGQVVYNLALSGATSAQFSGTLGLWGMYGAQYSLASPSSAVPRHRGFVN